MLVYLVTGGTGSLGHSLIPALYKTAKKIIIFSRDEYKQWQMQQEFPDKDYPNLRFFLGDVRDKERVNYAFKGVDIVIHAAALKQVPALEYNPTEAIKTNIEGSKNVVEACLLNEVKRAALISTDKAVKPINLYGATKLVAEKLFMDSNHKSKPFCCVRYGNVISSRGSVIPLFKKAINEGKPVPITHPDMSRFWLTLPEAVQLVRYALNQVHNCIYVPLLPSMNIMELARALGAKEFEYTGIRAGEKIHEYLVAEGDNASVRLYHNNASWPYDRKGAYTSKNCDWHLTQEEFRRYYLPVS